MFILTIPIILFCFAEFFVCLLADAEDEKESDQIVNQVLDEIGVSLNEGLVEAPGTKIKVGKEEKNEEQDKALQARFNNLGGE